MSLPIKEDLIEYQRAAKDAGVADINIAVAAAIEAHGKGEVQRDTADAFFALARVNKPELFAQIDATAAKRNAEHAEIKLAAFGPAKSPAARGKLVLAIGERGADEAARAWNLNGLHDYKSLGIKPGTPLAADDKGIDRAKANPWSAAGWSITRQGAIAKAGGLVKAQQMASAAGSFVGATKPAK
jgi:hypothetical protein